MPKPRTTRSAVRLERKRKRRQEQEQDERDRSDSKRRRHMAGDGELQQQTGLGETEFFGMLSDEEQEYFRRADELLELNQFSSTCERDMLVENVYREAQGKELKLASSQSCSRLMERLIQLSTAAQKKHLMEAFGGHFLSLVRHRFASHCCEALFLRSAGVVTQELAGFAGFVLDTNVNDVHGQQPEASMESLFLATLDELEENLSFLITDKFASHTLRVLLLVLSGRPLEDGSAQTLMKSRKKENISVAGSAAADEQNRGPRAVPGSFTVAVKKIIDDSTAGLDATGLRVLSKHPIGNPTLQLLLDLDMTLNKSEQTPDPSLLYRFLPGAPKSLADGSSEASEFINSMVYDQIGSRLIETLVTHCPGKVFKALNHNIFLPRIQGYVRNDISSYPAIKVLNRLGKDDLVEAVAQIAPTIPQLVSKASFNVLKTLFERCAARGVSDEIKMLMKSLKEGCGSQPADLITTLCRLEDDEDNDMSKDVEHFARNQYAIQSHGAQLLTALLSIPGPSKGVQEAILALPADVLLRLATTSMATVTLLTTALSTPSLNSLFQKSIVGALAPHSLELATSKFGHNQINAIAEVPSKGKDFSVPCHMKEAIMQQLSAHEAQLRDCWMGRSVWRSWKGDMWKTRKMDWAAWTRGLDARKQEQQTAVQRGPLSGGRKPDNKREEKEDRENKEERKEEEDNKGRRGEGKGGKEKKIKEKMGSMDKEKIYKKDKDKSKDEESGGGEKKGKK